MLRKQIRETILHRSIIIALNFGDNIIFIECNNKFNILHSDREQSRKKCPNSKYYDLS